MLWINDVGILTLHSNLVQFKQKFFSSLRVGKFFFTFQSGTIQARSYIIATILISIYFTFQSGTIQAWLALFYCIINNLYIPIWYNSSLCLLPLLRPSGKLYIPIWYNSSDNLPSILFSISSFTFQSGTIQARSC